MEKLPDSFHLLRRIWIFTAIAAVLFVVEPYIFRAVVPGDLGGGSLLPFIIAPIYFAIVWSVFAILITTILLWDSSWARRAHKGIGYGFVFAILWIAVPAFVKQLYLQRQHHMPVYRHLERLP